MDGRACAHIYARVYMHNDVIRIGSSARELSIIDVRHLAQRREWKNFPSLRRDFRRYMS